MTFDRIEDWDQAVEQVKERLEGIDHELYGLGVSMGANLLLSYEAQAEVRRFKALTCISCPFDIQLAQNLMKGTVFEPYIAWGAK